MSVIQRVLRFVHSPEYLKACKDMTNQQTEFDETYISHHLAERLPRAMEFGSDVIIGSDVLEDLEFFKTYRENGGNTVYDVLNKTHLKGSAIYFKHLLQHPTTDVATLSARKRFIKGMRRHALDTTLEEMACLEDDVLWLYSTKESNIQALHDMVYFRFWITTKLNKSPLALTCYNIYRIILSPTIGIISPIIYFVIPYLILRYKYGFGLAFTTYIKLLYRSSKLMFQLNGTSAALQYTSCAFTLLFYFQGILNSVELSHTLYTVTDFIVKKTQNIAQFLHHTNDVIESCYDESIASTMFNAHLGKPYSPIKLPTPMTTTNWWLTKNFGAFVKELKLIDREHVKDAIARLYMVDVVHSLSKLVGEEQYCFAKYIPDNVSVPIIHFKQIRHPCLGAAAVANDVHLIDVNMVLTGPNAGGKSTYLKSVLANIILSQTVGLCSAKRALITPFHFVNSQINIPDYKGKESLFQAEMNRCKYNIDVLDYLRKHHKYPRSIIVLDEVFNSTNPIDGISGAYAVAQNIGIRAGVCLLLSTHFAYLTKLGPNPRFSNYKMEVLNSETATGTGFVFPYKIKPGVSDQHIAIELLEESGFDPDIIRVAKEVREDLRL